MALKTVSVEEIPPAIDYSYMSDLREFADDTVREFYRSKNDAALVQEAPKGYKTQQVVNQLRNAACRQNLDRIIKVMQRKNEVYLKKED